MTLPACPIPSFLRAKPHAEDPRSRTCQPPLRPRDAAQVARTATRLFLGEGSIDVTLAADAGGRLRSVLADIAREYRLGLRRCDRAPDSEAAHAALELEMGVKVLMRLSDCLGALFDPHGAVQDRDQHEDVARRAALIECAAAIADEALVCRDERAVNAGAAPVQRCLTISAAGGEIRLHKFCRWQRSSGPRGAAEPDRADLAADGGTADAPATHGTEMDACLSFRIRPWRRAARRRDGDARRVLLRCRIRPVRVGDARRMHEAVPIPGPGVRHRLAAGDWRGALLALLIRLFRLPMRGRGELAGRAQLKVYPMPRDGRAAVVVRVGGEGARRHGYRAAIHGIEAVRQELQGPRRLLPALAPEPACRDDDGVRCY
ncbi:hypothetical protein [Cupriavidus gilardii]|uniref:hypothetical protein n=1 Tax=Cupriavidus gilardii TaxID=82541 RepID=UPI0021BFAACF|nr:hypothetical protein [Cupriavidus gilardii]MCT9126989.1 hypothetical protein [Cupriavidus gilardii]